METDAVLDSAGVASILKEAVEAVVSTPEPSERGRTFAYGSTTRLMGTSTFIFDF
jgi:hypothetical protein